MKDLFNRERIACKSIEIPEKLDFLTIKSINEDNKKIHILMFIMKILLISSISIFIIFNIILLF